MRLNLAQALMCRSDLLLLDEPTNHLDLDAILWLEDWLNRYTGTLVLISHDRDFLDATVDHILHIEGRSMTLYTGNYSAFERTRAERLAQQQQAFEKQQREKAPTCRNTSTASAPRPPRPARRRAASSSWRAWIDIAPAHVDSAVQLQLPRAAAGCLRSAGAAGPRWPAMATRRS
jgi:ATP-binding cassette subfamily F protein 3